MTEASAATEPSATGRTRRRRSGRRVALGLVLGVVTLAASALSLWYFSREPDGPILAMVAAGDDAVLLRRGYEQRGYVHLVRWSPERGLVWSEALFGAEFLTDDDWADLTLRVDDNRVFVRAREARGHAELHVFALADGTFHWRGGAPSAEPPEGRAAFGDHPHARLVLGEFVWTVHGVHEDQVEVVANDREGAEVQRVALPVEAGEVAEDAYELGGDLYVLTRDGQLRVVRSDGRVDARMQGVDGICRVGEYLFASNAEEMRRYGGTFASRSRGGGGSKRSAAVGPAARSERSRAQAAPRTSKIVSPQEATPAFRPVPGRVLGCSLTEDAAITETPGHEVALQREDGGAVFGGASPARVGRFGRFARIGELVFDTEGAAPRAVDLSGRPQGDVVVDGDRVALPAAARGLPNLRGVATSSERVFLHDGDEVFAYSADALEELR